jgi:hypothetical protein
VEPSAILARRSRSRGCASSRRTGFRTPLPGAAQVIESHLIPSHIDSHPATLVDHIPPSCPLCFTAIPIPLSPISLPPPFHSHPLCPAPRAERAALFESSGALAGSPSTGLQPIPLPRIPRSPRKRRTGLVRTPVGVGRDCGECLCRRVDSHPASDSPVSEWDLSPLKACPPLDPGVVASVGWDEIVHVVGPFGSPLASHSLALSWI